MNPDNMPVTFTWSERQAVCWAFDSVGDLDNISYADIIDLVQDTINHVRTGGCQPPELGTPGDEWTCLVCGTQWCSDLTRNGTYLEWDKVL